MMFKKCQTLWERPQIGPAPQAPAQRSAAQQAFGCSEVGRGLASDGWETRSSSLAPH